MVYEDHNPCITHIISVLHPSLAINLNQLSTPNMIRDPMFTTRDPCPHHQRNDIFVRRFGVPFQSTATLCHAGHFTASDFLRMYSKNLPHTQLNSTL